MPEAFGWHEGQVSLHTGTASAYVLGLAQQSNVMQVRGYQNSRTLDGVYHDYATGQRANVTLGAYYTPSHQALQAMFDAATAVHLHFRYNVSGQGSAGLKLWSGRIDALQQAGNDGQLYQYVVSYHANIWSAYG